MWPRITVLKPCWKEPLKTSRIKNVMYCTCIPPELEQLPKIISTYRYVPTLSHLMSFISSRITLWTWLVWSLRHRNTRKLILRLLCIYSFYTEPLHVLCIKRHNRLANISTQRTSTKSLLHIRFSISTFTNFVGMHCCSLSVWTPSWVWSIRRQVGRSKCHYIVWLIYLVSFFERSTQCRRAVWLVGRRIGSSSSIRHIFRPLQLRIWCNFVKGTKNIQESLVIPKDCK